MVLYARMKRFGSISSICSALILSACTLTPAPPASPEEAEAQALAAQELADALRTEYRIAAAETREAAAAELKERARREAEAKAEAEARAAAEQAERAAAEAAEQAAREAEAAAEQAEKEAEAAAEAEEAEKARQRHERGPRLLSSRARRESPDDAKEEVSPTPEQQEAARKLLEEQARSQATHTRRKTQSTPAEHEPESLQKQDMRSVLRVRRFAPPEEAISREDDDEPMPNSVELRGLRSPVMKGRLPMNIDGKINKED